MVKEYTDADVLAYWDAHFGVRNTRVREYTDVRNYFIALLHFKFAYIEEELADIFDIHRSSVNHAKRLPYNHMEHRDPQFLQHTEVLVKRFPYILPEPGDVTPAKLYPITLKLNKVQKASLKKYASAKDRRINQVGAEILISFLKKWDI